VRVRDGRQCPDVDRTAAEEPLEVRLHGRPFAMLMHCGSDLTLTAGFLLRRFDIYSQPERVS